MIKALKIKTTQSLVLDILKTIAKYTLTGRVLKTK